MTRVLFIDDVSNSAADLKHKIFRGRFQEIKHTEICKFVG